VLRAFQLWVASAIITVIGIGLSFLSWSDQKDQVVNDILSATQDTGETLSREDAEAFATVVFGATVAISLVITALILLFAFRMKAGKNWARIVLTIIGGISALFAIVAISGGGIAMVSSLLQAGLIIAAIVFMYQRASGEYFAKQPKYTS
jgi:hypothetical protein